MNWINIRKSVRPWKMVMRWNIWKSWSEFYVISQSRRRANLLPNNFLVIFSFTSKYLTIIYISAGITFVTSPLIFYIFNLPREEWMQPITVRLFFTDRKSHPGYEINFFLSVYIINILCVLLAGNTENRVEVSCSSNHKLISISTF